jgi:selT/selW/selH-like putative selenoprotein
MNSDIVFVVESCQNCKEHHWNTRHDEAKYQEFFQKIASAIIEKIPNAMVMKNQIPKSYLPFDLYNNLIPNDNEDTPYFQQVPRTGAFEVSYKGMLVFSKLKGGYWPNCELVATKCQLVVEDEGLGKDCTQYMAGNSPMKGGGIGVSTRKQRSPSKIKTNDSSKQNVSGIQDTPVMHQPPQAHFDYGPSNDEPLRQH